MFTGGGEASTRERLVQLFEVSDLIDLREQPVGKRATAAAGNLPAQQLDRAAENPVVMRFFDLSSDSASCPDTAHIPLPASESQRTPAGV